MCVNTTEDLPIRLSRFLQMRARCHFTGRVEPKNSNLRQNIIFTDKHKKENAPEGVQNIINEISKALCIIWLQLVYSTNSFSHPNLAKTSSMRLSLSRQCIHQTKQKILYSVISEEMLNKELTELCGRATAYKALQSHVSNLLQAMQGMPCTGKGRYSCQMSPNLNFLNHRLNSMCDRKLPLEITQNIVSPW